MKIYPYSTFKYNFYRSYRRIKSIISLLFNRKKEIRYPALNEEKLNSIADNLHEDVLMPNEHDIDINTYTVTVDDIIFTQDVADLNFKRKHV